MAAEYASCAAWNAVLPHAIGAVIAEDPSTPLAAHYRRWVRTELIPYLAAISDVLKAHSIIITLPSKDWLSKTFPDDGWYGEQRDCPLASVQVDLLSRISCVMFARVRIRSSCDLHAIMVDATVVPEDLYMTTWIACTAVWQRLVDQW